MASVFASATRRGAQSSSSSLASTSTAIPHAYASSSRCPTARLFTTSSISQGKSRPGEGKKAQQKARRAARLANQTTSSKPVEQYTLGDAFRVLKAIEVIRPLSALEVHIVTSVSRSQSNALRGRITFPHSPSPKLPTILIVASEGTGAYEAAQEAKQRGAPIILGSSDMIPQIANGQVGDFDKVLATPDVMPTFSRHLARSLGPKGLMPNAKRGTIAESSIQMKTAIDEALGASDWRGDRQAVIRAAIGRINFNEEQVRENMQLMLSSIVERVTSGLGGGTTIAAKGGQTSAPLVLTPRSKGVPLPAETQKKVASIIKQVHLSSTQGPGILLDLNECL